MLEERERERLSVKVEESGAMLGNHQQRMGNMWKERNDVSAR